MITVHAREREHRLVRTERSGKTLELRGRHTRIGCGLLDRSLARERVGDRKLTARLARDPLVGIQAGERTARADVPEARRGIELRARIGEVELLNDARSPTVEEVGAERENELRVLEAGRRPGDTVRTTIGFDRGGIGFSVDTQMRRQSLRRKPAVEEAREAARLVVIEENGRLALRRPDGVGEARDRVFPRRRLPRAAFVDHRRAEAIGIVETLRSSLTARAERALAHRMVGIALELEDAAVARLRDHAAGGDAFAADRGVVRRDAGNGVVRRDEIWNELPGRLAARRGGNRRGACAENLEELAAFDACFCGISHFNSGSWRSRSAPSCVPSRRTARRPERRPDSARLATADSRRLPGLPSGCSR